MFGSRHRFQAKQWSDFAGQARKSFSADSATNTFHSNAQLGSDLFILLKSGGETAEIVSLQGPHRHPPRCHPDRNEGSEEHHARISPAEILRFAQDDRMLGMTGCSG
jgi:hypothetical protein